MCEEPVGPFASVGVEGPIQMVLTDGLRVDNVGHTLDPLQSLQGLEQHPPCHGLATARGADHHETMVDLGDLVQLQHL